MVRLWALGVLGALAAGVTGVRADPVLSEFMAANTSTLADDDGTFSDWVEIYNPDASEFDLAGWYLTDAVGNKTKWQFPAVTLPARGYIVVFASNKDRRDPTRTLHTNFALSAGGEYLGLIKADGTTIASEFAPAYPAQRDDISYGRVAGFGGPRAGFLRQPTPGAPNGGPDALLLMERVTFSRGSGPFSDAFELELGGANPDQRIRYVVASGADAANADTEPTRESPLYSGPIALTSTAVVRAAVFSEDAELRGFTSSAHYLKIDASLASFSSQLPILVLDDLGAGELRKDGIEHLSWVYGYDATGEGTAVFAGSPNVASPLIVEVRGSSSAEFPKKGYNVKLRNEQGGRRAAPLFGLPAHEKWALVAPWAFDQSYINNAFVYALSNRLDRWAPRTRFVEVFFNAGGDALDRSDYAGIYVVTDRIEPGAARVDVAGLASGDVTEPAITGGYILKIDPKDADETGWRSERGVPEDLDSSIVLVAPAADEIAPAQIDYIRSYVQRMENALHADRAGGWAQRTYLDYIDRASWIDHHLLNVFVSNPDALHRSAYFTKDRGGKLKAGPVWDFDRALGAYWDERAAVLETWSGVSGRVDVWRSDWWGVLAEDPEFRQDWVDRWQALRKTELVTTRLVSLAQNLANAVGGDAAARDAARWPDTASPYGNYLAQIGHLKEWLASRAQWIDRQFVAAPEVAATGDVLTFVAPVGALLIYTLDGSDPRSLGGAMAAHAQIAATTLEVPGSTNIHVRSYNESLANVFPGSPWSGAVGGPRSTPLSPRARLTNISSRALVGAADGALIAGVVIADTEGKRYLSRAVGPGLAAFGAAGTVPDPQLSIIAANGVELFRNNGWQTGPDAAQLPQMARAVGAFPLAEGGADSALASALGAGAYTVQITTPTGQPGIGLVELYDLDANGRTVNLSTRAQVRPGEGALFGGFVVQGPALQRMLIRAVGPTLAAFGVPGALADPVLTLFAGAASIATNDRWSEGEGRDLVEATSRRVGAFSLAADSEDAALLVTLAPGAYTVEVRGKDGAEGVALLEIYTVP